MHVKKRGKDINLGLICMTIEFFLPPQQFGLLKLNRNQGKTESVTKYAQDILFLCMQLDPEMTDERMGEYFLDGLLPSLKNKLLFNTDLTFFELRTQAQLIEQSRNIEYENNSIRSKNLPLKNKGEEMNYLKQEQYKPFNNQTKGKPNSKFKTSAKQNSFGKPNNFRQTRTTDGKPICQICRKSGHSATICWFRFNNTPKKSNEKTNTIETTYRIKDSSKRKFQVLKTIDKVDSIQVQPVIDTGSTITIISDQLKNKLSNYKLIQEKQQNTIIKASNGELLDFIEKVQVPIEICN